MIFFRADANSTIGVGHMMRCISIAKAIIDVGEEVLFITADHDPDTMLDNNKLMHVSLDSDYRCMEGEIEYVKALIDEHNPKFIIIDSYQVTDKYIKELSLITNVAYMDDMCEKVYPANLIINYNIQADEEKYKKLYAKSVDVPEFVLGLPYVPLRKEFGENSDTGTKEQEKVSDIIFTAGGADPMNISATIAEEWIKRKKDFSNIRLHIVCGPFYKFVDELKQITESESNIILHINVSDMVSLMDSCQLAIASTGSTIYELCARGVPTVSYYFVDNQRPVAEEFAKKTPVKLAGDYSQDPQLIMDTIFHYVEELEDDRLTREEISCKMKNLVDGCGAKSIASKILNYDGKRKR